VLSFRCFHGSHLARRPGVERGRGADGAAAVHAGIKVGRLYDIKERKKERTILIINLSAEQNSCCIL
jgi:hypothetical protein